MALSSVDVADFDAVFYPGGHGPLWDLAEDADSITLIERAVALGKPVAAVCHAPAALRHVKDAAGAPLVRGKRVTGFSNTDEAAVDLTDVVPFSVEDMLRGNGGDYRRAEDWNSTSNATVCSSRARIPDRRTRRRRRCSRPCGTGRRRLRERGASWGPLIFVPTSERQRPVPQDIRTDHGPTRVRHLFGNDVSRGIGPASQRRYGSFAIDACVIAVINDRG